MRASRRIPLIVLHVDSTPFVENHSLGFKSLRLRQFAARSLRAPADDAPGADHSMPWNLGSRWQVSQRRPDLPRIVWLARQIRDLAVGGNPSGRNLLDNQQHQFGNVIHSGIFQVSLERFNTIRPHMPSMTGVRFKEYWNALGSTAPFLANTSTKRQRVNDLR